MSTTTHSRSTTPHHPQHPGHSGPHGHRAHGHAEDDLGKPVWRRGWFWGTGLILIALGVGAYITKQTGDDTKESVSDTAGLIGQIKAASDGWVQGSNVYGGELKSLGEGSRHTVMVTQIPSKVCVEAGLALAKEGIVTVNGVLPPRISAGKLAVLCSSGGETATLGWTPR